MNYFSKKIICIVALISTTHLFGASILVPRSQSFNAARQIVGWNNPEWGINRLPQDQSYGSLNLIFEYTRSFRNGALTQCLFGDDLVCLCDDDLGINISGSAVSARGNNDWLADYFGLPRDFQSTVSFNPIISNFILDFSFYAGLDGWVDGLYFKLYGPFVHTRWNLNASECVSAAGTLGYFQGYFSSAVVPVGNLNTSFLSYANGCGVPTINNDDYAYGETACLTSGTCSALGDIAWQPLCCSRIDNECDCNGLSRNGFGELRFVLGYNFLNNEEGNYHLGVGIYAAAPTGSRVGGDDCNGAGRFLFQPIVGNGHHWELGAQVTAHHIWWRSEDEDKSFGLYLEADVTHLFGAHQTRCFDLCSAGQNSRYMLAQLLESNSNTTPRLNTDTDSLGLQFANVYAPVANVTSREVTSTIGAQGDVAFTLSYQSGGFQWDLGYDFWGRSCEKLCINNDCCNPCGITGDWALKGDQRVYGFADEYTGVEYLATRLAATDSGATIRQGSNLRNSVDYTGSNPTAPKNFYADNSTLAFGGLTSTDTDIIEILPGSSIQVYTSEPAVLISECDFNMEGTRGISNKIFTHLNWAWANREDCKWTPYLGIGAEVEFGSGKHNECCATDCDTSCAPTCETSCAPTCETSCASNCCENCALSQWGIWFKVGTSYN